MKILGKAKAVVVMIKDLFRWMLSPKNSPLPYIPFKELKLYTMEGKVRIKYWYINGLSVPKSPRIYKREEIDFLIQEIRAGKVFYYKETDLWLRQALGRFGLENKEVAIMGSENPVYESFCLAFGGKPTTIEYKTIISEDERIRVLSVDEYSRDPKLFDAAISISSFEHDGLGRYGDPLNADGDLLVMEKMKSVLRQNGILFLAVPVGKDTLVWNAHRIYGKYRLPLLLQGWERLAVFGFSEDLLNEERAKQPVFVLRNKG